MPHTMQRREFLAVASVAAIAPMATAGSTDRAGVMPSAATLRPIIPTDHTGPTRGRLSPRSPIGMPTRSCSVTIEPMRGFVEHADRAADIAIVYPESGIAHLAWSSGGHSVSPSVTTVAPTDLLGRVRLRVTMRGAGCPVTQEVVFRSDPGTHLIAIPMHASAKTPAWRRCVAQLKNDRIESIHDTWRPSDAAPGCLLVRVTLRATTETDSTTSTEHADA